MTVLLAILAALVAISAAGAAWDLLGRRRGRRQLSPDDAQRRQAEGTLTYYGEVGDSTEPWRPL